MGALLLLGAPILAFLIDRYGWRAAYVALALLNGLAAVAIFRSMLAPQVAGVTKRTSLFGGLPRAPGRPLSHLRSSRCGNEHFRGDGRLAVR